MGLLDGLFDKEQMTRDTIQGALENVAEELNCNHKDLFFMIKPVNEEFDFKVYIYQTNGAAPKMVREIPLKEILEIEE